jgi:hypothetical protein
MSITVFDEIMLCLYLRAVVGCSLLTTTLHVDNRAAVAILPNPRVSHQNRYIAVHWHTCSKHLERGEVAVTWVAMDGISSDMFIKDLAPGGGCMKIGLC